MGLDAIAAAAQVAAAVEEERQRQSPTASETTDVEDSDPFESDGSINESGTPSKKKRRSEATKLVATATTQVESQASNFPAEMLLDLAGSTSAQVRRMNDDERALVHYKRRLRNRESAKRSRARRQATISDIQGELEDLREVTASLLERCVSFARSNDRQTQELETLRKEKQLLESMLRSGA